MTGCLDACKLHEHILAQVLWPQKPCKCSFNKVSLTRIIINNLHWLLQLKPLELVFIRIDVDVKRFHALSHYNHIVQTSFRLKQIRMPSPKPYQEIPFAMIDNDRHDIHVQIIKSHMHTYNQIPGAVTPNLLSLREQKLELPLLTWDAKLMWGGSWAIQLVTIYACWVHIFIPEKIFTGSGNRILATEATLPF